MLSTDGKASFAAMVYKNPYNVVGFHGPRQVGFDAGDKTRGVNILGENSMDYCTLLGVNIFRIDGMQHC